MLTTRQRLMRRRGKVDPIWIHLGIGPGKSTPEPKPDKNYYYKIRQKVRRTRFNFAKLEAYDADLLAVAAVTLEEDSWIFQRRHLSALLWAFRRTERIFKACPFPHVLSAIVRNEPYESHNLYIQDLSERRMSFVEAPPMTSLPPFLAARISLDQYEVLNFKESHDGHCFLIRRKHSRDFDRMP